ncbi:MAG TPA: Ig-like domain-containing protein, partial [Microbacterium sp.]|nr:Ig-like domain-containing protein [Microbacterium sp.]
MSTTRTAPLRRVLASVLTGALIASAAVLGIAAPANAADLSMAAPEVPRAGGTVTIEGSGYLADSTGVYLSVRDEGAATDVNTVWIAVGNTVGVIPGVGGTAPMNADGSFSVQIDVPAFTEGTSYVLHTRRAHGQPEPDPNQLASVAVLYEAAPAVATSTTLATTPGGTIVEGTSVTLTATVSPAEAAGTVTFRNGSTALGTASASDGTATFSTDALPVGMASLAADFAATDAAAYTGSTSGVVSLEVTATPIDPPLPVPAVTVSSTSGLDPAGETITVTGTGFMPNPPATNGANRPPLLGAFAGAYVAFGSYLDMWRPSEGAPSAARQNHDVRWGVHEAQLATIG